MILATAWMSCQQTSDALSSIGVYHYQGICLALEIIYLCLALEIIFWQEKTKYLTSLSCLIRAFAWGRLLGQDWHYAQYCSQNPDVLQGVPLPRNVSAILTKNKHSAWPPFPAWSELPPEAGCEVCSRSPGAAHCAFSPFHGAELGTETALLNLLCLA